jgi:hypothetical protein
MPVRTLHSVNSKAYTTTGRGLCCTVSGITLAKVLPAEVMWHAHIPAHHRGQMQPLPTVQEPPVSASRLKELGGSLDPEVGVKQSPVDFDTWPHEASNIRICCANHMRPAIKELPVSDFLQFPYSGRACCFLLPEL